MPKTDRLNWYVSRLKAMSPREILWRAGEKVRQKSEAFHFRKHRSILTPLYPGVSEAVGAVDLEKLGRFTRQPGFPQLPTPGTEATFSPSVLGSLEAIRLLGPYRYEDYCDKWHAGFNTPNEWPLLPTGKLNFRQRDDIGDPRLNWELNRHRQFTRLAAAYAAQKDTEEAGERSLRSACLRRLESLLTDWSARNPFLHGIAWTSPMEIAIRCYNWLTTARLLASAPTEESGPIVRQLLTGAANMAAYLRRHMSGFSSANNHLIVEAMGLLAAGNMFSNRDYLDTSLAILQREFPRQVSADGVDLESSLHYHGFVLEAYLLSVMELRHAGMEIPQEWPERLMRMADFIRASRVCPGLYATFGDDDQARILDTGFGDRDYFGHLLSLTVILFGTEAGTRPIPSNFPEGGYSFIRSGSGPASPTEASSGTHAGALFAAIDHAPLGFGAVAAHAHADTLSFQLFVDGEPVLTDPGTYLYNVDLPRRNSFRSTRFHNTVTINGTEQSEMLGAFLWGRKATTVLTEATPTHVEASVTGLCGITHRRSFTLAENLAITDSFSSDCSWEASFLLAPGLTAEISGKAQGKTGTTAIISRNGRPILEIRTQSGSFRCEPAETAPEFGFVRPTCILRIAGNSRENRIVLHPFSSPAESTQ